MLGANSAIKNTAFLGQHEAHTFPFCISRNGVYYNCCVSGRLAVTFFSPSFCPALDEHLHDGAIKLYPLQNHTFIVLVCKKAAQGFCGWQCGLTTRRFWLFVAFLCGFPELVSSGYSGWYSNSPKTCRWGYWQFESVLLLFPESHLALLVPTALINVVWARCGPRLTD